MVDAKFNVRHSVNKISRSVSVYVCFLFVRQIFFFSSYKLYGFCSFSLNDSLYQIHCHAHKLLLLYLHYGQNQMKLDGMRHLMKTTLILMI